jgi:hypothetical protein
MWCVDPFLGNDSKTTTQQQLINNGSANKHVSKATKERSNNGKDVFYAVRAEML